MDFNRIIWRDNIKDYFAQLIAAGRVPNSVLFLGPEGNGMLAHALLLAQSILCINPDAGRPCGTCNSCKKVMHLTHPDISFTYPTMRTADKKNAEDYLPEWLEYLRSNDYIDYLDWMNHISGENIKKGNISKDECQRIIQGAQMKPYEGAKKVFIIWKSEYLSKEGNRLLKTLEEPSESTHFILLCNDHLKLLPTIISRCHIVRFGPYATQELATSLSEQFSEMGPERLQEILALSDQSAFRAHQLAMHHDTAYSDLMLAMLRLSYGKKFDNTFTLWINKVSQLSRDQSRLYLQYCIHFFHQTILLRLLDDYESPKLLADERKAAQWLNTKLNQSQLEQLIFVLNKCLTFVDRNANTKILFTNIITKLVRLFYIPDYTLETI